MRFTLKIDSNNAAFADEDRAAEVARLLVEAAEKVEGYSQHGVLFDINGNRVGQWYFGARPSS